MNPEPYWQILQTPTCSVLIIVLGIEDRVVRRDDVPASWSLPSVSRGHKHVRTCMHTEVFPAAVGAETLNRVIGWKWWGYISWDGSRPQWSECYCHSQVKCAQLHGPQSRCPSCLRLEVGLLTLEIQNSSPETLFLLLLILFQYEMFPDSAFMLIYTQMYLHLAYLTFTLLNISTRHSCCDPFRLCVHPVLGCGVNVIKCGYTTETPLETEQRLWFLFSFCYFFLFFCFYVYTSWN